MRPLDTAQLMDIWEQGIDLCLARRALVLLAAALPDASEDDLCALPVGRRDALLMQVRAHLFGSVVSTVVHCPACGERLESVLALDDLRVDAAPSASIGTLACDDCAITFHAPTAGDLVGLPLDATAARRAILARCVVEVRDANGHSLAADTLQPTAVDAIVAGMAAADPQADIDIGMVCAACRHGWDCAFDIASFLWSEIDAWAQRVLRDVHTLARAYAWRECDVLAMSATRRQLYLQMATS